MVNLLDKKATLAKRNPFLEHYYLCYEKGVLFVPCCNANTRYAVVLNGTLTHFKPEYLHVPPNTSMGVQVVRRITENHALTENHK